MATKIKFKESVTMYLKSGNSITLKFNSFEITKLSGSVGKRTLKFADCEASFSIDADEIDAVIIRDI